MESKIDKLATQFYERCDRQKQRRHKNPYLYSGKKLHNFGRVNFNAFCHYRGANTKPRKNHNDDQVIRLKGVYMSRAQDVQRAFYEPPHEPVDVNTVRCRSWRPMTVAAKHVGRYIGKIRRDRVYQRMDKTTLGDEYVPYEDDDEYYDIDNNYWVSMYDDVDIHSDNDADDDGDEYCCYPYGNDHCTYSISHCACENSRDESRYFDYECYSEDEW